MAFRFIQCNRDFNGANMKLHLYCWLGLGMSRNVSGISNSLLQWCCDGNAMFAFSAIKGPVKELRLSFMLGEKYVKKTFYYFQGLRTLKCHRTKRLNCVNYQSKWPLQKTFSSSTPPPAWISRVFAPPPSHPSCENIQNPIRRGVGGWIFSGTTQFSENFWERSSGLQNNFGKSSESGWKSSETPTSVCLYNKKDYYTLARRYEFYVRMARTISHSFAVLTRFFF